MCTEEMEAIAHHCLAQLRRLHRCLPAVALLETVSLLNPVQHSQSKPGHHLRLLPSAERCSVVPPVAAHQALPQRCAAPACLATSEPHQASAWQLRPQALLFLPEARVADWAARHLTRLLR